VGTGVISPDSGSTSIAPLVVTTSARDPAPKPTASTGFGRVKSSRRPSTSRSKIVTPPGAVIAGKAS